MDNNSNTAAYTLHVAMAALVGASLVAVSAYYMHRKTLSQLLDFAKSIEQNQIHNHDHSSSALTEEDEDDVEVSVRRQQFLKRSATAVDKVRKKKQGGQGQGGGQYKNIESFRRFSASLPDVTTATEREGGGGDERRNGPVVVESVPAGLPRLETLPEGRAVNRTSSVRPIHLIRPASPKSVAGSDDEEDEDEQSLTTDGNLDSSVSYNLVCEAGPNHVPANNANGGQVLISAPTMMRTKSISADLHGVQPDPIAADIMRKEPEHETFVQLKIAPYGDYPLPWRPLIRLCSASFYELGCSLLHHSTFADCRFELSANPGWGEVPGPDEVEAYLVLQECLGLRESYVFREHVAPWEKEVTSQSNGTKPSQNPFHSSPEKIQKSDHFFQMEDGVVQVYTNKDSKEKLFPVADATTFFTDLHHILRVIAAGNMRTLCHHRLVLLEQKFNLHLMLNADREFLAQKTAPHRDFYNVRKVDTHVHHSACMNQKHLLRFIKSKLVKEPDEVVIFRDGTYLTLKEVFESLDLTGYDLNVDLLDVHADKSTFHRFDKFNLKYNPCGQSRLREIFLKQDNLIQGRFLAELTKQVFSDLEASKYQMAEYRISIYGRKQSEWDQLASWIVNNDLHSANVVWLIQIPRLYNVYKEMGIATSFQNMLDNIFLPLFEVTVDPDSHPQLHLFLQQVVGMDLVDDESKPERRPTKHMPTPTQWTNIFNPAFTYYAYYCYANLYTLNKLRESKGMSTIKFRPHAGEAGDVDHLAATFLTAHNISHGINLRKSPVLQYLYYLAQIGLAMSPLSNNSLFLDYHRNPFPLFFQRGLNVSLSTDDPIQIHLTKEPLVEEYSIAASVWKLSSCDLCEIARNSVLQSGFAHGLKSHWIGHEYFRRGPDGNDIHKTNVPRIRLEFRHMIWKEEMQQVYLGDAKIPEEMDT
ncbi:AMP deaminase-like protein [Drosera capensis]